MNENQFIQVWNPKKVRKDQRITKWTRHTRSHIIQISRNHDKSINQTKKQIKTLKPIEEELTKRIYVLKSYLITTKSRYLLYKTVIKAKFCYTAYIIWQHNQKYAKEWEAIICKILKWILFIRVNIKNKWFRVLKIEPIESR